MGEFLSSFGVQTQQGFVIRMGTLNLAEAKLEVVLCRLVRYLMNRSERLKIRIIDLKSLSWDHQQ